MRYRAGTIYAPPVEPVLWRWNGVAATLVFEGLTQEAVIRLKYRNLRALAAPMATVMADLLREQSPPMDALVPVPLHPRQLRRRGYNQSELLAHEIGRLSGLPVWDTAIRRAHEGQPQVSLESRESRWANVAGAFSSPEGAPLAGRELVLIDDVMTTGSTLHGAATALKEAGARSVWGLVFAREL